MEILVHFAESCLLQLHLTFGSWGLAILGLTVLLRALVFPVQIFQFSQQRKMRGLQPEIDRLSADLKDQPTRLFSKIQTLKRGAGVKTGLLTLVSLLQLPIFLGIYRVMASTKILKTEHFLWLTSLGSPDVLFILPAVVALISLCSLRMNSNAATQKSLQMILPAVSFFFMVSLPASVALYYATSGALHLLGEVALKRVWST